MKAKETPGTLQRNPMRWGDDMDEFWSLEFLDHGDGTATVLKFSYLTRDNGVPFAGEIQFGDYEGELPVSIMRWHDTLTIRNPLFFQTKQDGKG